MNQFNNQVASRPAMDVGLREFMLGTYRWMMAALAVTTGVAWVIGNYFMAAVAPILFSPFALLGFVIAIPVLFGAIGRKLPTMTRGGMLTFLFGFAAFLGVFMAAVAAFVPFAIVLKIFLMTVAMFAGLSLFGYTTGFNLGTIVKYAAIAFVAYVAINLLGAFFPALAPTGTLDLVITGVALVAISVIIAWETQHLKQLYYSVQGNEAVRENVSIFGAASLLLAFVNLFQILLSLFGRE